MMCFRDMTFCPFWRDCADASRCHRPLTYDVVMAAERWWRQARGDEMPPPMPVLIAQFAERPDCHRPTEHVA
jgi:hypothetical protein